MGAWRSKPSVSRASPVFSEPRSLPTASVLAKETRDGARGSSGVLACIAPSEAAGPLRKRLRSTPPEAVGGAKRVKDAGKGVVPDTALLNDDGQFQESESLLFSRHPLGAASDMELSPSGSAHGVQPMSLIQLDKAKHKIFLSHSGAQKDFVEQLCVDLERVGFFFPFFDRRHHSLPKGEVFAPLIIQAAQLCQVAVIVLSEEFLCSKWPMIELAEFYSAQHGASGSGSKLKLLSLFFKLSIEEVKDEARWMPFWKKHAACDDRIDLSKWSAAVKALCKSNGLNFEEFGKQEVAYRKGIVESIFKLSPPNLLYGISERMVGCNRICEVVSTQFVEDITIGARVLGIYGVTGLGKTMLAKALHDYFYGEFLGKVCYFNMRKGSRVSRQKKMLKKLCDFKKDMLAAIDSDDDEEGLMQMKDFMKRERVFLILDDITYDACLLGEVREYLSMGFHPKSQILLSSSSKAILEDLLPNLELYMPMPTLMVEEAQALFLKHAAPMKAISDLTNEEYNILGICLQKCWFDSLEDGFYHPVALVALADYFSRMEKLKARENDLSFWKDIVKEMDFGEDVLKTSKILRRILNLQFSTFDLREKLLFFDIVLYSQDVDCWCESDSIGYIDIRWFCRLHDESPTIIEIKLLDLRSFGMIDFELWERENRVEYIFFVPSLYEKFAEWYATEHKVSSLKNAWGVFQLGELNLRGDSSTSEKKWSNLLRLRINPMTVATGQLVASKRMQELSNLVVLQLRKCDELTTLNLEGLHCLRDLELSFLGKLKIIKLSVDSSEGGFTEIYNSLQHVRLKQLASLEEMPDLRPCTSLHSVFLDTVPKLRDLEGVNCRVVKDLKLSDVPLNCLKRILKFDCLPSLERLEIFTSKEQIDARWRQDANKSVLVSEVALVGEGPCAKLLRELFSQFFGSNMVCTRFRSYAYLFNVDDEDSDVEMEASTSEEE